ncbi:ribosomal protein L17 [Naematelia encephala]|uniref:Ribosomal protein L17 n=1 Tax=Naematelia encephala TaxID=71784 RepID=A0A1Y2AUK1_9TREE|nr:ribosomal protein L17 [Naematelia encephala]
MQHGRKLLRLQGKSPHNMSMMRNLVSALLHHEQIKTTYAKAKVAAQLADRFITLGKKNTVNARRTCQGFLRPPHRETAASKQHHKTPPPGPIGYPADSLDPETFDPPPTLFPKVFGTLAERYSERAGGYTRIVKYGRRQGDNAPHAIVCLVDGPRDVLFEMAARTAGREIAQYVTSTGAGLDGITALSDDVENWEGLADLTRKNLAKALKYRDAEAKRDLVRKAKEFADTVFVEEKALNGHRRPNPEYENLAFKDRSKESNPYVGKRHMAGERMSGMDVRHTGLGLARGDLGKIFNNRPKDRRPRFLSEAQVASAPV